MRPSFGSFVGVVLAVVILVASFCRAAPGAFTAARFQPPPLNLSSLSRPMTLSLPAVVPALPSSPRPPSPLSTLASPLPERWERLRCLTNPEPIANNRTESDDDDDDVTWNLLEAAPKSLRRYALAFQLSLAFVGFLLVRSPSSLMKPKLLQEPGLSIELFSMISSTNSLMLAAFTMFAGRFIDRFGGVRMLTFQLFGLAGSNMIVSLLPSGRQIPVMVVTSAWLGAAAARGLLSGGLGTNLVLALRREYPSPIKYATGYSIVQVGTRVGDTLARCFVTAFPAITGLESWRAAVLASGMIGCVTFLPLLRRNLRTNAAVSAPPKLNHVSSIALLRTLMRSPRFLLLAATNLSVGLVMEIATHWTDLFMYNVAGVSRNASTAVSSIVPLVKFAGSFVCGRLAARFVMERVPPHRRLLVMQLFPITVAGAATCALLGCMNVTSAGSAPRLAISVTLFGMLIFGIQIHQDYIARYESLDVAPSKEVAGSVHALLSLTLSVSKALSALVIGQVLKRMTPTAGWQALFKGIFGITVVVTGIDLALARMTSRQHPD